MKKLNYKFTAIFLIAFISFFTLLTVFREKGIESYQENRTLAVFPQISAASIADGSYFNELGNYITDYFGGRSYWISSKAIIDGNNGESIVNGVYITDSMLLEACTNENVSMKRSPSYINEFAFSYDGTLYVVAVPSSSGVYCDLLPEYLSYNTEKQQIDRLYSSLNSNIRKIDAYNILKMLNDNYIYYRNDSKWTSYGAYCVYRTVIQKLGFLPSAYDKYTIEHVTGEFRGDLYNKTQYKNIQADMLDIYNYNDGTEVISCTAYGNDLTEYDKSIYDKSYIDTNDMYKLYLGDDAPLVRIKTSVNNERKLLIIKDSYADCFIPFLFQHYSEIAVISPECMEMDISSFINVDDYEQTLFLFGIDSFSNDEIFNSMMNINRKDD